jgi:hypothetical protein
MIVSYARRRQNDRKIRKSPSRTPPRLDMAAIFDWSSSSSSQVTSALIIDIVFAQGLQVARDQQVLRTTALVPVERSWPELSGPRNIA